MDIFKIATYVGYLHCDSAVKVAFPVVQAVFLIVQVVAFKTIRMHCKNMQSCSVDVKTKQPVCL